MPLSLGTDLFEGIDAAVAHDAPLGPLTWFGIGGRADALAEPRSVEALCELLRRTHEAGIPVRVLGEGANLLVDDDGVDGVVVRLTHAAFRGARFDAAAGAPRLRAGGGAEVSKLTTACGRRGLAGIEQLIGIPASVGGAVRMNAGGKFGDIGSAVESIRLAGVDGGLCEIPAAELRFGYRHAELPSGIVVEATLRLNEADPATLRERMKEISACKAASQPLKDRSAGCMFRNPMDPATGTRVSAGMLIDRAGLKGTRLGSATVSDIHGNFIVAAAGGAGARAAAGCVAAEAGARAADIRALAELVARRVEAHCGIALQREVVFWKRGDAA